MIGSGFAQACSYENRVRVRFMVRVRIRFTVGVRVTVGFRVRVRVFDDKWRSGA